jgi:hypothetical protein
MVCENFIAIRSELDELNKKKKVLEMQLRQEEINVILQMNKETEMNIGEHTVRMKTHKKSKKPSNVEVIEHYTTTCKSYGVVPAMPFITDLLKGPARLNVLRNVVEIVPKLVVESN